MAYDRIAQLPASVRQNLPKRAQLIYKEAFNSAWEHYADPSRRRAGASRQEVAHRVAWSVVRRKFERQDARWVSKGE